MIQSRRLATGSAISALLAVLALVAAGPALEATQAGLPARLTDQEFWSLSEEMSESHGQFQSDNLLSNEIRLPDGHSRAHLEGG